MTFATGGDGFARIEGGSAAARAMLRKCVYAAMINIEFAIGRIRPTGGQGTGRSTQICEIRVIRGSDYEYKYSS
jgi:hypothetical protein